MWRLRQRTDGLIDSSPSQVELREEVRVDLHDMVDACRGLIGSSEEQFCFGPSLLDEDLLPDWYDDWLLIERERLRQLRLHALERMAERHASDGQYAQAVEAALLAVAGGPFRESAHRVLIDVHLQEGNTFEAIRQYRIFADLLERELGLAPSEALRLRMEALTGVTID